MIRKNAVSVKVKAPSRGLVTRWPSETADRFYGTQPDMASLYTGMILQRACAVAQNVRFEDGVMAAAPGYETVGLSGPFSAGSPAVGELVECIYEGNVIPTGSGESRPLVVGTESSLWAITRSFTESPRQYTATNTNIYTGTKVAYSLGYWWSATDFYDKLVFAKLNNIPQYNVGGGAFSTSNVPGLAINSTNQFSNVSDGNEKFEGVTSFFGHLVFWRKDQLVWSDLNDFANYIPVGATAVSGTMTLTSAADQPAAGSTTTLNFSTTAGQALVAGQYVRGIVGSNYNYFQVVSSTWTSGSPNTGTAVVKLLGTTGISAAPTAGLYPIGQQFLTCDANEAGTARIVGAQINGPIFKVIPVGDYAYIMKEWSITSMQYVGQSSGTFFTHTEMTGEGMIGRNAAVSLGNGAIVFLGHRELYSYTGGAAPTPVCRQYTRQLLSEVDRSQLDNIVVVHRVSRNEVWVVYPVTGGQKVLIWNYVEDTASLDVYNGGMATLTAGQRSSWPASVPWQGVPATTTWANVDPAVTWDTYQNSGLRQVGLLATGGTSASLLVHGEVFSQNGASYTCLAETMDYDFGDDAVFKYVDVVHIGLQVLTDDTVTRNLYVQVGARSSLDQDITDPAYWTVPQVIQVQGGANFTAKVNPGGTGRYIRLRFYSQDTNVQWRISSFEIYARAGGTY